MHTRALLFSIFGLVFTASVHAQTPATPVDPPAPPAWKLALGAGLAITGGNSDTSTFNASYDVTYDPKTRHVFKSDALFLRGTNNDQLAINRFGANVRHEFSLHDGLFVFGRLQYLQDEFKLIDYFVAPSGGLGYTVVDQPDTTLAFDAGVGGVWEKNPGVDVFTSGAITLGQKLTQSVSSTAAITESAYALWKTEDFGDALYTFGIGLSAAVSTRTQVKVEFVDVFKSKPVVGVKKNDTSVVVSLVFKN